MAGTLQNNGNKLVPLREVVSRSKYTRDYIAKLARENLVTGTLIGRQWFIDEGSLERFTEASEMEAEIRRRHLSRERRREREIKLSAEAQYNLIERQSRYCSGRALAMTIVVFFAGIVSLLAVYKMPLAVQQVALVQKSQVDSRAIVVTQADQSVSEVNTTFAQDVSAQPVVFADILATESIQASSAVLFLPAGVGTSGPDIAAMFSDAVAVTYVTPDSGLVTGTSSTGTSSIPFVIVPVMADAGSGPSVAELKP